MTVLESWTLIGLLALFSGLFVLVLRALARRIAGGLEEPR